MLDLLIWVEVEPVLATLLLRSAIPGERQRLQPSIGEFDQVLLQRIDAERVFHLERGKLAVGAVGLDQKLPVLAKKARLHPVIVKGCIGEVTQDRFIGCVVHRVLVLRSAPQVSFRPVAARTCFAADKRCAEALPAFQATRCQ